MAGRHLRELQAIEGQLVPQTPCIQCGALSNQGRCERHRKRDRPMRWPNGWAATRWRQNVLDRHDHTCAVEGCRRMDVQAHHTRPMAVVGPDPNAPGIALCGEHHKLADARNRKDYATELGLARDTLRCR